MKLLGVFIVKDNNDKHEANVYVDKKGRYFAEIDGEELPVDDGASGCFNVLTDEFINSL